MAKKRFNKKLILPILLLLAVTAAVIVFASKTAKNGAAEGFAVRISEVMTANTACPDENGRITDWVELENTGGADFDLGGWYLSDEEGEGKYRFPAGTGIPAHGILLVPCSLTEDDCAPFALKREGGEWVTLMNENQTTLDKALTVACEDNQSLVRTEDGSLRVTDRPSPGFPNGEAGERAWEELLASRSGGELRLSELMSSNSLYPAADGSCTDWIEVYNPSDKPVVLTDYHLSDREGEERYTFPEGATLAGGEYLVIACVSGGSGEYTASFALARAGGETVSLIAPNRTLADSVTLPALQKNTSYALQNGEWSISAQPTPGFGNDEAGYKAYLASGGHTDAHFVISELSAKNRADITDADGDYSDWIELRNDGESEASLAGWYLSDDEEERDKWAFPDVTLAPQETLLVFASGKNRTEGELHTSFSLSVGETVTLSTPNATPFCSAELREVTEGYSLTWNGESFDACAWPTPGETNDAAGYEAIHKNDACTSAVRISEVVTYIRTDQGWDDNDWVELTNTGSEPVELSGWSLSEREDEPGQYPLPTYTLYGGEYYVFSDKELSLNAASDMLWLFDADGAVRDRVFLHDIPYGGSCGRIEGENGLFYFAEPTKGGKNGEGFRRLTDKPTADTAPGVYDDAEKLTVALSGMGDIRYTTDGSIPTEESELYTKPITVSETTVLRARSFAAGLLPGDTLTLSYFLRENSTLPIVSLVSDRENFFGGTGIFDMNETAWEQDWERECSIALFDDDEGFTMDAGMQIHGRTSRRVSAKKSVKLKFRDVFDGELHYDIFGDGVVTDFSSILLRASIEDKYTSYIRDILFAELARQGTDVFFQNYRFVNMYLNGEYYGIYAIREHHSEDYFAAHTGADPDNVTILGGEFKVPGPWLDLLQWAEFTCGFNLNSPEQYAHVEELVDIEEMIDWLILECYSGNIDVFTNVRFYSAPDYDGGRYNYALMDLDLSLMNHKTYEVGFAYDAQLHGILPLALRSNPTFRELFLKRLVEMLDTTLSKENVWGTVDALADILRPEAERDMKRWGYDLSLFDTQMNNVKSFTENRVQEMVRDAVSFFRLSEEEAHEYFADYGY